ncbi:hypothetical protein NM688_g6073 [Phlebia brevispora]|uniref:Uncharacterized protein n=1 Tax=Phlebia brevispora TaxID=194682 RepID=A0ACC1SK79_9APHY|nr:hypothetical protein NM688_g6073 [Phlebia brevispora]
MVNAQLTAGICERLVNTTNQEEVDALYSSEPTVQILSIKKVGPTSGANAVDRYRIIVSDGEHFTQAMMATQLNHFVEEGLVGKNTIVIIEKFTSNFVQEKRLLIVLALRVVAQTNEKIGNPQGLQPPPGSEATTPAVTKPASTAAPSSAAAAASSSTLTIPSATTISTNRHPGQQNRGGKNPVIFPIEGLSPYQNNWTIKARVTQKSDIRTWANQRGEGKLFNVTLMDDSGEIRATGFNTVVDELYEKLQEGKVYFISKARVNLSKKKFNPTNNEYELSLERNTEIEECRDLTNIPVVHYNFTDLKNLGDLAKDSTCDVVGIVTEIGPTSELTSRFNKTIVKRELTIVDRSGFSVRLTLWGKQAQEFNPSSKAVIAWKNVKVGDFGGRSLSMMSTSMMEINPDIPEAHALRGWYDAGGSSSEFKSQTTSNFSGGSGAFNRDDIRFFNDVREAELGMHGDKAEYFSARGTIMHVRPENLAYPACQTQGCNKKVIEQHDGWRCERCDRSWDKPSYRYIVSMAVADHSGQAWLQGFNDAGQTVFNMTADELMEIKDRDDEKFNKIIEGTIGTQFNFTCRAKQETFNDQARVRYGIQKILPLDYKEEGKHLMALLSSDWAK